MTAMTEQVYSWLKPLWLNLPENVRDLLHTKEVVSLICAISSSQNENGVGITPEEATSVVKPFMMRMEKLKELRGRSYAPQKSQEWLELRKHLLTASNLADALNRGKFSSRSGLIAKKAAERQTKSSGGSGGSGGSGSGPGDSFCSFAMKWGNMFEPMIARIYTEMKGDIELYEFGLIQHPSLSCFGASPDGITSMGTMVEIKCPLKRPIVKGDVPDHYYLQIQGQLAVCEMEDCDYIEVVMEDFQQESSYFEAVPADARHGHGIFLDLVTEIRYSPPKKTPQEAYEWLQDTVCGLSRRPDINIARIYYWKMKDYNLVSVPFDRDLWKTLEPQILQFWKEVEEATVALNNMTETPTVVLDTSVTQSSSQASQASQTPVKKRRSKKEAPKYTYRDDSDD